MIKIEFIYLFIILLYVFVFPLTKVEESFNLQAIHDLLIYKNDLSSFDHFDFPGVVPRTFIGALTIASLSWPFHYLSYEILGNSKFISQIICRSILGIVCWYALCKFTSAVEYKVGRRTKQLVVLCHILQFHLPFYSSRTLPNTYALIASYLAYSYWLRGRGLFCLVLIGSAAMIFRCDLVLLVVPMFIQLLAAHEVCVNVCIPTVYIYAYVYAYFDLCGILFVCRLN